MELAVISKSEDIEYVHDYLFEEIMEDYYREIKYGYSSRNIADDEFGMAFFNFSDEVVAWIIDEWAERILAHCIAGEYYEGILMPGHPDYFFDLHWNAARLYADKRFDEDETLGMRLFEEFLCQLKLYRYSFAQHDYEEMLRIAPTTLYGRNTYSFPQREVW